MLYNVIFVATGSEYDFDGNENDVTMAATTDSVRQKIRVARKEPRTKPRAKPANASQRPSCSTQSPTENLRTRLDQESCNDWYETIQNLIIHFFFSPAFNFIIKSDKGDIINYGSRGSTKLVKFFCVFIDPPDEASAQTDDPPHLAGMKIIDPPTLLQKVHVCC